MKKFIFSILCVSVFFIGLGGLINQVGAKFKSDERALALIKQAQAAIGGEEAVRNVKSLTIKGSLAKTFDVEGVSRVEQGEVEINLQLPNQFAKTLKLRREGNATGEKTVEVKTQRNVIVMKGEGENATFKQIEPGADGDGDKQQVFVIKRNADDNVLLTDEAGGDLRKIIVNKDLKMGSGMNVQQNELFRTTFALLLTAPQGIDAAYNYLGDGDVDGNGCDIVEAVGGNLSVKLFLDKSSHLPRMISYQAMKPMVFKFNQDNKNETATAEKFIVGKQETTEFQIKFSDYRSVNGVLLPHRWTQTIGGNADETVDVSGYEINPANIGEKFQTTPTKIFIRTEKKAQ